jgi:hypothetical protein
MKIIKAIVSYIIDSIKLHHQFEKACKKYYVPIKVKYNLFESIHNFFNWLFSPCRRCVKGIDYHCIYCPHYKEL